MQVKRNTSNEVKESVIKYSIAITSGICLVGLGCLAMYKLGCTNGIKQGRDHILDEIVDRSHSNGLVMRNAQMERFIFTAEKLAEKPERF